MLTPFKSLRLLTILLVFLLHNSYSQSVGVNTTTVHPTATLEISSTDKGVLIPRIKTLKRLEISNPAKGLLVFDINTNTFWFFDGNLWQEIVQDGQGPFEVSNGAIHDNVNLGIDHFLIGTDKIPTGVTSESLLLFDVPKGAFRAGRNSFFEGWNQSNIGNYSFAGGFNPEASGVSSLSLGNSTKATALASSALGDNTLASGQYAFAAGTQSTASGATSTTFGSQNMATRTASMATGIQTQATGSYSFSAGRGTHAKSRASFALGRFNEALGNETIWNENDPILEVGIGDSATELKNALTILKNGKHGIGISNPSHMLDIIGDAQLEFASMANEPHLGLIATGDGFNRIDFRRNSSATNHKWTIAAKPEANDANSRFNIYYNGDQANGNILSITGEARIGVNTTPSDGLHVSAKPGDHGLRVQIGGLTKLRVLSNGGLSVGTNNVSSTPNNGLYVSGNTGIGVGNPSAKLEVDGAVTVGYESNGNLKPGTIRFNDVDNVFEGYDGQNWVTFGQKKYEIGDFAHGGIIFWLDESGQHGLVCSEYDNTVAVNWAPPGYEDTYLNITQNGLGQGAMNTALIIHELNRIDVVGNYAAKICENLSIGGYTDWYLPSREEAYYMFTRLADSDGDGDNTGPNDPNNLGNFEDAYYWQSFEYDPDSPNITVGRWFSSGTETTSGKINFARVRAVRKF